MSDESRLAFETWYRSTYRPKAVDVDPLYRYPEGHVWAGQYAGVKVRERWEIWEAATSSKAEVIQQLHQRELQLREGIRRCFRELLFFDEPKQEWFCRVCRYRDPLVDGNKLHADDCWLRDLTDLANTASPPPQAGSSNALPASPAPRPQTAEEP